MKKRTAAALAALTALTLTGCSFQDVMLYLYGGDSFVTSAEPDYTTCDGDNGVTVVYDQNQWEQPVMAQDDTLSLTTGNQLSYTVVLSQTTDTYTDFLAQSGQEDVARFDETCIVMSTCVGELVVTGEGLHIGKLTLDGGELHVDGHIDSISYEEPAAGRTSLLSRLFG